MTSPERVHAYTCTRCQRRFFVAIFGRLATCPICHRRFEGES